MKGYMWSDISRSEGYMSLICSRLLWIIVEWWRVVWIEDIDEENYISERNFFFFCFLENSCCCFLDNSCCCFLDNSCDLTVDNNRIEIGLKLSCCFPANVINVQMIKGLILIKFCDLTVVNNRIEMGLKKFLFQQM